MQKTLSLCTYDLHENKKIGEVMHTWTVLGLVKVAHSIKGFTIHDTTSQWTETNG